MAVYQDKAFERIKEHLRTTAGIINRAKKANAKEAETRTIVVDTLADMLGWNKYDMGDGKPYITAEYAIKGGYADYAIVKPDSKGRKRIYAIIEIKQVTSRLNEGHLRQARDYAINEGVQWIIVTNGDDWDIYRIEFNKRKTPPVPETFPLFSVTISDTDMRPGERADRLYLISEEASRKDELELFYQTRKAVSPENLAKRILTKEVIDKIRLSIKQDTSINISNEELAKMIVDGVIGNSVKLDNAAYFIKRTGVQKAAKTNSLSEEN